METVPLPNDCYARSPLLFWTIVAIGARKYLNNPTVIVQLGPRVSNLNKAVIARLEPVLLTVQALVLQCAWPMPFRTLCNDVTPVVAGLVLQLATTVGLHVQGSGQEFVRSKLSTDRDRILERGRLWACCSLVCQRVITTNGTPPLLVVDDYDHNSIDCFIPPSLLHQKLIGDTLTEAIVDLMRNRILTAPQSRLPSSLDVTLAKAVERLQQLNCDAVETIGTFLSCLRTPLLSDIILDVFYAQAAELHLLSFHLFKYRSAIPDDLLKRMYDLAVDLIELAMELDKSANIADFGPVFFARLLDSAAIAILRLCRSDISDQLDLDRGRKAYFALIVFHRKHSVRQDDAFARFSIILTNLWTSTRIFKSENGSTDSLHVRSRARLGMSMVYDCFWWWRQEYGRQKCIYDSEATQEQATPSALEWFAFDDMLTNNWLDMGVDGRAL
ncbi:Regulatory protein LEU3 [Pseudocercospora fuligena]|uniref:Regulatory protein LEU3 n=1 Tax=Pseudocercospora fuligena TaxID=685502 RepID=A0A8H6RH31_9PEZI|nr:Regulatory protein LEU3 [Pseudocercospora fuligena]